VVEASQVSCALALIRRNYGPEVRPIDCDILCPTGCAGYRARAGDPFVCGGAPDDIEIMACGDVD